MADLLLELADYLEDNGFGTVGTDIFVDQIPSEQNGIYLLRSGGSLNNYVPMETTVIDIHVKNTSGATAEGSIRNIKNFLHRMVDADTPNFKMYSILALSDIELLERDLEYARLYKLTVSIINRDINLIS